MSYEEAFAAFNERDFPTAAALLEEAARETGYASDFINHPYTLALYHIGDKARLADVAFQIASSMLPHDSASAMDYFQRAMFAGLDANRRRRIGEWFEKWAEPAPSSVRGEVNRIAHVVGSLSSETDTTRYLKLLVSSLRKQEIQSTIFTTEWSASWFFNPAGVPQSQPVQIEAEVKMASVEGDFVERAARIAQALTASGIGTAFFHANLAEQITARVASMRPVPVQVNVNHDCEMDADLFDRRIHLSQSAMRQSRFSNPAEWIPPVSDIQQRLQTTEQVTRQSMGLESASSVSATFGNLQNVSGREYLGALSEIMMRFPKHFHLFAGAGNVKATRSHLHSEGVLPRVRFLGDIGNTASLLGTIDLYLASFPQSSAQPILDAMGAGKPVVALRNSGGELVDIPELTAPGAADYLQIADSLLRNPSLRAQQGQAVLERFNTEFHPDRLGERYKAFLGENVL